MAPGLDGGSRRESSRLQESNSRRVLDNATRVRRLNRQLESLERDNYQEDPHTNLTDSKKKRPKFGIDSDEDIEESETPASKKKKKTRGEFYKQRFRKNISALLDEERIRLQDKDKSRPNYFAAVAPPSKFPQRHFCAVCGYLSNYTCVSCGARYCCVKCLGTHRDTRCLKWTV